MRRCYLHVGTPKTGSTTIQNFLHDHGPSLLRYGCFVPTSGAGNGGSHFPFAKAVSGKPVAARYRNCVREVLQESSDHPGTDMVVSTEALESLCKQHPIDNPVVALLNRNGFEVILVGYFRNQPQRINSGYAQIVKSLRTTMSIESRVSRIGDSGKLDYTFWNRFAAENGCQLLARPFNAAVRSNGIVEDFLTTLGILNHGLRYNVEARANRSPGPSGLAAILEIMRRAEQRGHRWTDRQRVRAKKLLSELIDEPQFAEEPFCGLDTQAARRIQAFYKPMNDRFAETVWDSDWATIFKEDVEAEFVPNIFDPATASEEAKQRYAAILDRLWSGMQAIMMNPQLQKEPELLEVEFD
jgi:hypothetical protein